MGSPGRPAVLLWGLLALWASSCATSRRRETLSTLEPAVLQFYEQLKWFNGEISKTYILPAVRPAYLDQLDLASRRITISSIEIIRITPDAQARTAVVRMRIAWTDKDENILQDTLVEASWLHDNGNWYHTRARVVDGPVIPILFEKKKSE